MNPKFQKFIFLANTLTVLGKKAGQPEVDLQANWQQFLKS
jgi:hypothetical protein